MPSEFGYFKEILGHRCHVLAEGFDNQGFPFPPSLHSTYRHGTIVAWVIDLDSAIRKSSRLLA